ncbi:CDC27 family protein [bacterium]|nr:CDC27 family protein [bacterium]
MLSKLLNRKRAPEDRVRDLMRQKKWQKALPELEKLARAEEQNFNIWNTVGDVHFRCGSPRDAIEAWRRAIDGFTIEGLYENALAIARKALRAVPGEMEFHLTLSELYLSMGYDADSLSSLGTYLRTCSRPSEPELRTFFRKVIDSSLRHPHLLEEILPLYREAGVEDEELQRDLETFVSSKKAEAKYTEPLVTEPEQTEEAPLQESSRLFGGNQGGLISLGTESGMAEEFQDESATFTKNFQQQATMEKPPKAQRKARASTEEVLSDGEGRDHYDLGIVYQEMKLWDAAVEEFEKARQDENLHFRASLSLAECRLSMQDPKRALELLEAFEQSENEPLEMQLRLEFAKGEAQEILGNLEQALAHFENIDRQQEGFGNVKEKIKALKKQMVDRD